MALDAVKRRLVWKETAIDFVNQAEYFTAQRVKVAPGRYCGPENAKDL
jgi:hypothetical protein